jgi:hypothetical protein
MICASTHVRIVNNAGCTGVKGLQTASQLAPEQVLGGEVEALEIP